MEHDKSYFRKKDQTGLTKSKDVVLPKFYEKYAQLIEDFDVRDDDIWICGFPKTGFNKLFLTILYYKSYYTRIHFQ